TPPRPWSWRERPSSCRRQACPPPPPPPPPPGGARPGRAAAGGGGGGGPRAPAPPPPPPPPPRGRRGGGAAPPPPPAGGPRGRGRDRLRTKRQHRSSPHAWEAAGEGVARLLPPRAGGGREGAASGHAGGGQPPPQPSPASGGGSVPGWRRCRRAGPDFRRRGRAKLPAEAGKHSGPGLAGKGGRPAPGRSRRAFDMRIKRFTAPDMRTALRMVREEQ